MAKLFYTIDEAASKLGRSQGDLLKMIAAGQLEEFKMHDQVHFKRAVIDQLVTDEAINVDLSEDDDLLTSESGSPIEANVNAGSGSALLDELKFDDDLAVTPVPVGDEVDFDLDEGLTLADSGSSSPAIPLPKAPAAPAAPPLSSDDLLDLLDSDEHVAINPVPAPAARAGQAPMEMDMDLGLDLDLGLDDSSHPATVAAKAAPGPIDLADSGAGSGIGSADASGSMAPAIPRRPAVEVDEFSETGGMPDSFGLGLETVGSGSGMLDQTTDPDESSLGAALLDDAGDDTFGTGASVEGATGLFAEPASLDEFDQGEVNPVAAAATGSGFAPTLVERVDSASSGLGLGLLAGALCAIVLVTLVVMGSKLGGGSALAGMISQDLLVWGGALVGGTFLAGGIGFFVGRALE